MGRVLVPVIAGCLLLGGIGVGIVTVLFISTAETATGTITSSETEVSDDGNTRYRPTFVFAVNGRDYTVTATSFVSPSPGDIGDTVPVLYDPRNPRNARIDAFVYTWLLAVVLAGLGIGLGALHPLMSDELTFKPLYSKRSTVTLCLWTIGILAIISSVLTASMLIIVPIFSLENPGWRREDNPMTFASLCRDLVIGCIAIAAARSSDRRRVYIGLPAFVVVVLYGLYELGAFS